MDGVLLDLRQQKQCTEDKIGRCMDSSNCEESNWNPSCQHAHSLERGNILRLPLNCTACGKSFSHSSSLRRHSRTHTGVRPFVCEICNKGFYYKNNLLDHSRTHTGEKPFKCSDCGQSFAQSSTLNRHTVTHSKDKTCKMCGEVFKLSLLEKHFASHTEKYKFRHSLLEGQRKKLSCQKCRMKFERVDDLQKPLWVHKDRGQALYNELATIKGLLNVVVQLRKGNLPSTVESFNTKICP